MSASRKFILGLIGVVVLGVTTLYEARLVAREREQLTSLRARQTTLAGELEMVRLQTKADADALAGVQRQIADARSTAAAPVASPTATETQTWLVKLATAKRIFAEHPEFGIPELQLLELREWLGAIKGLSFDTPEQTRQSLAAIRGAAKTAFTTRLSFALQKFFKTSGDTLPPDVLTLAPYFSPSVNHAILLRYQMTLTGSLAGYSDSHTPVIIETAPIDEEFDTRHGVNLGRMADGSGWGVMRGSFGGRGPAAWIDGYQDRLTRARADFKRDNPGTTAPALAQLAPYFIPPLPPATLEKLLKTERTGAR